jgi:hypothetical protein
MVALAGMEASLRALLLPRAQQATPVGGREPLWVGRFQATRTCRPRQRRSKLAPASHQSILPIIYRDVSAPHIPERRPAEYRLIAARLPARLAVRETSPI